MQQFIDKYADQITGTLSGFDRLVFRGSLLSLNRTALDRASNTRFALGMEQFLSHNNILFKQFADYAQRTSDRLKAASRKPFEERGLPVIPLRLSAIDKAALARETGQQQNITQGPVCAISSVEVYPAFEHRGMHMIRRDRAAGVLYHYQIHPEVGWMHARIQTWFPFQIQVVLNGREWLARQMQRAGLKYIQQDNCFVWLEDWKSAQQLLDQQRNTAWQPLLESFAQELNPLHEEIFQNYPVNYYWTCYQSEWGTDIGFKDAQFLRRLMRLEVEHGMLNHSCRNVLQFYGQRLNLSGAIPGWFHREVKIDVKRYAEGERVKYSLDGNTLKFYDKAYTEVGCVFRAAETTINRVGPFKEYRVREQDTEGKGKWMPMRKGIAALYRMTEISQNANERLINALAGVDDSRRVEELTDKVQQPTQWKGRRVRALRPWAEDKELLAAVNHGEFMLNGLRNANLQALLYSTPAGTEQEKKRRSAAVSRKLRMLRAHGVIQKVPKHNRYQVTEHGRSMIQAVLTAARTSQHQLNQLKEVA